MSPDDPRHGTYAGAVAHWMQRESLCDPCQRAGSRYHKARRLRALRGQTGYVPAIGTVRRLQALQALGWAMPALAAETGVPEATLRNPVYRGERVWASTAERVAEAYERLCMTRPEGRYAERSRRAAVRKGWLPPLAWDNIDDPNEQPTAWQYVPTDRATAVRDLADMGHGLAEVCRRLKVSPESLERWLQRHGMHDVYRTLSGREHDGENQWTREAS